MKQKEIIKIKYSILILVYHATINNRPIYARNLLKELHDQNITISRAALYRYLNELAASNYLLLSNEQLAPNDPPRKGIVYCRDTPLPDNPSVQLAHVSKAVDAKNCILNHLSEQTDFQDTCNNISHALNINQNTLKHYIHDLKEQGLIKTLPGRQGGIRLLSSKPL